MSECSFYFVILNMDRKKAILKSVLKIVNREGFYHLNMKKIAQEAGVAAGTIYLYFKGKEDLINALYLMIVEEFNEQVLSSYCSTNEVYDNYKDMMTAAIQFYIAQPDYFSFVEQYTYAPFLFKQNQEENFQLLRPMYQIFKKGKETGVIKNIQDAFLISLIHGPLNTIIKLHLAKKVDLNEASQQQDFLNAVWSAVSE